MKKSIMLFIDIFGCGGIEKFLYNVCKFINRDEYDVSVVSIVTDKDSYYINLFKEINVPIIQLIDYKEVNPIKRMKIGHKMFRNYIKKLDKNTIIHFNISNSLDMKYAIIARNAGFFNLIYHSHNSDATSTVKRMAHYFFKPFRCNAANINIACSKKAADWLFSKRNISEGNYLIVNNAIDASLYEYCEETRDRIRNSLGIKDEFLIGHVGRYNIQKNHDYLINIFLELIKIQPNSKLLLIGDGELYEQTFIKINKYGINDKVISIRQTNKVNEYLQAMDAFALPSLYEGLPFVLVEEQAASLPAIVSDTITHEIAITDYIKYVSLEAGAEKWAKELIQLSNKKRGSTYNQIVESGFDIHKNISKIEKIYDSLTSACN